MGLLFEDADHRIGNALDLEVGADGRFSAEQLFAGGIAQYHNAARLGLILLRDQPAVAERQRSKTLEGWPDTHNFTVGGVELAYLRNRASQFRADLLDQIAFIPDDLSVIDCQRDFASCCQTAHLRASPSAPDDDQVLA